MSEAGWRLQGRPAAWSASCSRRWTGAASGGGAADGNAMAVASADLCARDASGSSLYSFDAPVVGMMEIYTEAVLHDCGE